MQQYGDLMMKSNEDFASCHAEAVKLKGYTIIKSILTTEDILKFKAKILEIYGRQVAQFGEQELLDIKESNVARCILKYDYDLFKKMIFNASILEIVSKLIEQKYVLSLQNAVLNKGINHHQGSWHRDLPYQNFLCNEILSVNVLYALDPFTEESGGTCLLPYSMHFTNMPSNEFIEENMLQPKLDPGDILIFNSMILHRAGQNLNGVQRISVNNQFIRPFIQPQYRFNEIEPIKNRVLEFSPQEKDILGFNFPSIIDDIDWRNNRLQRAGLELFKVEP